MDSIRININNNWKFHYGECEEAFYKGYDDSNFRNVCLPHDWSVTMPFEKTNSSGTGYLSGGIGWYRLHFKLPEEYRGKHIMLCFDGIYKNSHVWVNSYNLGKHPYGYTPVYCDISKFAFFGDVENVVAVKVSHNDIADSRWFTGSGITRKATILVEEQIHPVIDGTYLRTDSVEGSKVNFTIHHEVQNDGISSAEVGICHTLFDGKGQAVWSKKQNVLLKIAEKTVLETEGELEDASLWEVDNPCLYTLRTSYETTEGSTKVSDDVTGFRTFCFDADTGFSLNGKNMKIKGVCVHHDAGALGAAVTKEVWERRLLTLKECGCNAIRCSHNPHMPELYDLCDELGFLMMDEAFDEWECPKNKWSTGHNVYPPKHQGYAEDFPEWHERDLRAMVRRDRKHPSVIMWSIGNEIDYPNDPYCHPSFETMTGNNDANKPKAERMYDPNKPNAERMVEIAKTLVSIVKEEDTERPVTMALAFPELSAKLGVLEILDIAGYNYKEHLYEQDHRDYPGICFLGSENGHEYKQWCAVKDNAYISGQFLWTGIDYLGEAHGWPIHGSGAGVIDLAGFTKHRFEARKAYWCEEPFVSIATRKSEDSDNEWIPMYPSWNYENGEMVLVRCFSNLSEVALLLNDKEFARQKGRNDRGVFQFEIPFTEGKLSAVAFDENGNVMSTDEIRTAGEVDHLEAKTWKVSEKDNENYIYQIEICAFDKKGIRVITEDAVVTAEVSGKGRLLGMENGNLSDNTPYCENRRGTFKGKLLLYVKRMGYGSIEVRLHSSKGEINSLTIS